MRNTCLNEVHRLAKQNKNILFIGSDLGAGTLASMKEEMPDRFFMEGISEQHIIGMSAGLAMEGFIPYVNSIAPFLTRRCYEQVLVDLCLHDLPDMDVDLIVRVLFKVWYNLGMLTVHENKK